MREARQPRALEVVARDNVEGLVGVIGIEQFLDRFRGMRAERPRGIGRRKGETSEQT
jgi:hypothetical protein